MKINYNLTGRGRRPLARLLIVMALAAPMAACDSDRLVEVEDFAQRRPEDLTNIGAVPALVAGAFRQFVGGYSGFGDDAFLSASAVISDETYYGDTFPTREAADKRTVQPATLGNITDAAYGRLQQARFNARRGFAVIDEFSTSTTAAADAIAKAQLRAIEGYVYVTLSEGWCGAVPFTTVPDSGPIDPFNLGFGTPLSARAMNDTAASRFADAVALNPANRLAAIGRGRALLNLGRYAEAAAAVTAVPTTFVFRTEHSSNTAPENNPIFSLMDNGRYGISALEGGLLGATFIRVDSTTATSAPSAEGLPFRTARDPRIPYIAETPSGRCFSSSIFCWRSNNHPNFEADVPIASGVEARLIEAEAALQAGNATSMLTTLNSLRSSVSSLLAVLYPDGRQTFPAIGLPTLDPLADPAVAGTSAAVQFAARRNLLFSERAFWLYLTGHRQGDLRRLVRNYGLPANEVFPSGPHFRGGNYGTDVAYPVPFQEENNPNYSPSACVTSQS